MAQSSISKCNSCNRETGDLFCYDCKKHLCRTCKTFHDTFTKGHTITQSKNVDKAVLNTDILCGKHSQEYAYFCKGCKCLICGICAVKEHKSHKFDTVADTALKFRENLKTTATKLDSKAKEVLNQIEEIENGVLPDLLKKKHVFEDEVKLFSEDFLGIVREVTASQLHSADEWVEREQRRLQQHLIDLKESRDQILGNGKFIENQLTIQHDSTFLSLTFHENLHLKDTEIIPMLEATPLEELDKGAYVKTLAKRIQTQHDMLGKEMGEKLFFTRLSKEMGENLIDNNSGIADMSDPNRSTKIAEKYNSLYDNDWTDALEYLTDKGLDEENGARFLLEIMKHVYSFCKEAKSEQIGNLKRLLDNPVSSSNAYDDNASIDKAVDKQINQLLEICVKMRTKATIQNLQTEYLKLSTKARYADRLPGYTNKCIEICWLMNTHSPPLVFAEPVLSGGFYDKDQYKEFTKKGDTVSYILWLPMLIEEKGAILSKGVVQPVPSLRSEPNRGRIGSAKIKPEPKASLTSDTSDVSGTRKGDLRPRFESRSRYQYASYGEDGVQSTPPPSYQQYKTKYSTDTGLIHSKPSSSH